MGRQAFRRRKSDGTIDDGTGGGGKFSTGLINSTKTFLLINDNSWPLHACTVYSSGNNSRNTAYSYDNSHMYFTYWPFIAPRSGDISKISIYIGGVHGSESDVSIGIYDANDGHINNLLGTATFAGDTVVNTTGTKSQTSFETNAGSGSSATITLVEGDKYFYGYKRDNTDTTDIDFYADGTDNSHTIMRAVPSNWGSSGYMCFYNDNTILPANEAAIGWIQHASRNRLLCWIEM